MRQPAEGSGFRLGKILGIPIYVDMSWFIIFALITLTLSQQFSSLHPGWTPAQHWMIGILTSVLFFASIVFHEMSHSVVAMHYKIPVQSITLFVFGGLARIGREAENARQEFNIAIAGPLASFFLAGCFWLIAHYGGGNEMVHAASTWLSEINAILGLFNLAPGFPLDGGRILRGIVWGITKDYTKATRFATVSGKAIAYAMILYGVWIALVLQFPGHFLNGLWLAFIGWFLLSASQESYVQVAIRSSLTGVRAADIMSPEVPAIARDTSIEEYIHEVLRTGRQCHIVMGPDRPVGLVTLQAAATIPRDEWNMNSVQAVMLPVEKIPYVSPDEPAVRVLDRMQSQEITQMPVVSDGHIVGMIARDNIFKILQTRMHVGSLAGQ
ncbi:MAG TPA: site-2 protease family protein [Verrucomicrobiae bacterium]|nr:site-2 protease family protein [Verrucomicrobiae bacterium]